MTSASRLFRTYFGALVIAASAAGFYVADGEDLSRTEKLHIGEWLHFGAIATVAHAHVDGTCSGLQAWSSGRCHHQGGGYAGLCDYFTAFTFSHGQWVAVQSRDDEITRHILGGVIFETMPPN